MSISEDAKAILLLTAPLLGGRREGCGSSSKPLLHEEYQTLAHILHENKRTPADLLSPHAAEILQKCPHELDPCRLQELLNRGFLLSHAIQHWQTRAIWVVSRADDAYPSRLKTRLRGNAPAVLYGCGDIALLGTDETLVFNGTEGADQAAMWSAIEQGGKVCAVLADGLEKAAMKHECRNLLIDKQLVLVSPCDPGIGFKVGNAVQQSTLIHALADVPSQPEATPAETLLACARKMIMKVLANEPQQQPMNETEIMEVLGVGRSQTRQWLKEMVEDETLERPDKRALYKINKSRLF